MLYDYITVCDNYENYSHTIAYMNYMVEKNNILTASKFTLQQIIENSGQQIDWLSQNIKYFPLLTNIIEKYPKCLLLNIGTNEIRFTNFNIDNTNAVLNNSEQLLCFVLMNEIEFDKHDDINKLFFNIISKLDDSPIKQTDMYNDFINYYDALLNLWKKQHYI